MGSLESWTGGHGVTGRVLGAMGVLGHGDGVIGHMDRGDGIIGLLELDWVSQGFGVMDWGQGSLAGGHKVIGVGRNTWAGGVTGLVPRD